MVPFITASGQSDVLDFLFDLKRFNAKAYAKYLHTVALIEEHGTEIASSHWSFVGDGLGEIRWRHLKVRYRIYCSEETNNCVFQCVGTTKDYRAMENADRVKCLERRLEYRSPQYDQERRYYQYRINHPKNV